MNPSWNKCLLTACTVLPYKVKVSSPFTSQYLSKQHIQGKIEWYYGAYPWHHLGYRNSFPMPDPISRNWYGRDKSVLVSASPGELVLQRRKNELRNDSEGTSLTVVSWALHREGRSLQPALKGHTLGQVHPQCWPAPCNPARKQTAPVHHVCLSCKWLLVSLGWQLHQNEHLSSLAFASINL